VTEATGKIFVSDFTLVCEWAPGNSANPLYLNKLDADNSRVGTSAGWIRLFAAWSGIGLVRCLNGDVKDRVTRPSEFGESILPGHIVARCGRTDRTHGEKLVTVDMEPDAI
jgi:hypothetical protein